jgi:CBS domain-containing protein
MKAVSIAVRIADFLRDYPPFRFLDREELIGLAAVGRVKFHESGEYIFMQGQPRDANIYVIQQGRVRVIEHAGGATEKLVDLRGPGDLLGLQGILSEEPYLHTCMTEAECILYVLPRARFVALIEASAEARRYLAAYFSLSPAYHLAGEPESPAVARGPTTLRKGGLFEVAQTHAIAREQLVTVTPDAPVAEVAARLNSRRIDCVLVVDRAGRPLGWLSDADLRARIGAGAVRADARAGELMFGDPPLAHPDDDTGRLLVKLVRCGTRFLAVTEDGTAASRAIGIVSERGLLLQYGRFPTVMADAIFAAPDVPALRVMRDRVEALIREFIDDRATLPWLMTMTGELNRALTRRLIELATAAMRGDGWTEPGLGTCWLLMGSGGRDELLIRSATYHALVYADPPPAAAAAAALYFQELARRVGDGLRQCGFPESEQGVLAHNPGWCLPLRAMCARFRDFIARPEASHVYHLRDAFDFTPVHDGCPLAGELRATIRAAIRANPGFIRHMANDSLLSQPPRTIFQGYVVDSKGGQQRELAIKFHAILPLVDVGRVLALEAGDLETPATWQRLTHAAGRATGAGDDAAARLLQEAADAFLVAQHARVSRGLQAGTDGTLIAADALDAETRALLVTAFRNILASLEFIARRHDLELRA